MEKKQQIQDWYYRELNDILQIQWPYMDPRCEPVFWFTSILVEDATTISEALLAQGIQTRRFFYPLHLQPCYKDILSANAQFEVSEKVYSQGLSLPSSYILTEEEQSRVIGAIRKYFTS